MDKLRALLFLCRVVEKHSFVAAANDLRVVPSVLSKSIAQLEASLGFKLFNRTTRRVSLTEDGSRYYATCKRLLSDLDEAEQSARKVNRKPAGRLLAGLHPSINRVLMARFPNLAFRYPELNVETTITSTLSTLVDDRLDVLMTLGSVPDSSFTMQTFGKTRMLLVATPAYLSASGRPLTPSDLSKHAFIMSGRPDGPSFVRLELIRRHTREHVYVSPRLISRQGIHMHEACLSGAGIARLAEFSIKPQLDRGDLVEALPDWALERLPVAAVYPSGKDAPAKVKAFIEFARNELRDLGVH